jgi:putative intracellular protease/amidase
MRILCRLAFVLLAAVLALLTFAGVASIGVARAMPDMGPPAVPPQVGPQDSWPVPAPAQAGRLRVAVVAGASGSEITDLLAPYEVFASSPAFFVYTVAAVRAPVTLFHGPSLLPDHTLAEVETSADLAPDVVVIPAVGDPTGPGEALLRGWVGRQRDRGAQILGVCSGSELLAASGMLDGRRATSHWWGIDSLRVGYPRVSWVRGQRYVQDGSVTTTAGVTSGISGALRLVEQLAGAAEAKRVGEAVAYPGWSVEGPTRIPVNRWGAADLAMDLNFAFPWLRPTVGVRVADGVGEIDLAATFDATASSGWAAAVPIQAQPIITTRHGAVLLASTTVATAGLDRIVAPAAGFGVVLREIARHSDRATASAAAKYLEYPVTGLQLAGDPWPWRPTALLVLALAGSIGVGLVPRALWRAVRRRRTGAGSPAVAEAEAAADVLVKA